MNLLRERTNLGPPMHNHKKTTDEDSDDDDDAVPLLVPIHDDWDRRNGKMNWISERNIDRCLNFIASILSCR